MKLRAGDEWRILRMAVVAWWAFIIVYVSIPDYGYDYSLFYNLGYDPVGWLHELAYITALSIGLGWICCKAEEWQLKLTERRWKLGKRRVLKKK